MIGGRGVARPGIAQVQYRGLVHSDVSKIILESGQCGVSEAHAESSVVPPPTL